MNAWLPVVCLAVLGAGGPAHAQPATGQAPGPGERPRYSFEELEREFASPSMLYAPFAFWFWDAPLDADQAARIAEEMCSQGLNPGYAHARNGLPHEQWLTEPWFTAFGAALDRARGAGAFLGYCDEYWWPSGRADGRVLAEHPEFAAVSLDCRTLDVPEGGTIGCPDSYVTVAAQLAEPYTPLQPPPPLGEWIWCPDAQGEGRSAWFRCPVMLPEDASITSATLLITADNRFALHVAGRRVAEGADWADPVLVDLTKTLHAGANVLAIEAANEDGPCGLVFGLRVQLADGSTEGFVSGPACRTAAASAEGWTGADFDDSGWLNPVLLGASDAPPWNLGSPADRRVPRTIRSSTLRRIGGGAAFEWTAPAGAWRVYSFVKANHRGIDGSDVNYLDRRLAPAFIELAHVPYEQHFGADLGRAVPGVFVDNEGDYGFKLAWSEDLEREYRVQTGVELALGLPLMLDRDAEGSWPKARCDWYRAVSTIYTDGFFGAVSRWLDRRGMYTISNLWEESLTAQAYAVGDFFAAQRSVTMPGNDCLVRKALEVHDFKETQSVTEFENRRFQSEMLGVAGWEMSPVLMKQAANAVVAWGVSHMVPHGINLNRRLDTIPYPPDWFTSNPFWPWLYLWTDFCRRACLVNSCGHTVPDVLLLNPMDSVWALLGGRVFDPGQPVSFSDLFDSRAATGEAGLSLREIERVYSGAIGELTAARVQYLIADDHYLRQMTVEPGGRLVRGPFAFRAIVMPSLFILPLDVAERIVEFAEVGGTVYLLGELPSASTEHGVDDPRMHELMERLVAMPSVHRAPDGVAPLAAGHAPDLVPQVEFLAGSFPLLDLHRRIDGREFFWLANNSGERQDCLLSFREAHGAVSRWDCESGSITPLASEEIGDASQVRVTFDPYEAFWLVFDPERGRLALPPATPEKTATPVVLQGPWRVRFDPSVQPPPPSPGLVPDVPEAFRAEAGQQLPLQAWSEWRLADFSGYLDYTTRFKIDGTTGRVRIDLGEVRHVAEVWVNGHSAGQRAWSPFAFDVTDLVRPGDNELTVRVGNLLCNEMRRFGRSGWTAPSAEEFRAGLFGPVTVVQER